MKRELSLEEIHNVTIDILKKIIAICEEINIDYYIAYGSLIGAVRHKGFIPWDDDCDLVMLRPDYEKFCKYCQDNEERLRPYKMVTRETMKKYPYNIGRFNDMSYEAVYDNVIQYDSGVFVDIYPLDGAGNEINKRIDKIRKKKSNIFRILLWSIDAHFEPSTYNKWYRTIIKYFIRLYSKCRGSEYFLNKLESLKKSYNFENSKYVAEMTWDSGLVLYKKEWFVDTVLFDFEGLEVKAPVGYDEFLKCHYGNYMELPPETERVPHHEYRVYRREKI